MAELGNHTGGGRFDTTRWTVVCAAQGATEATRAEALETLCRDYWYPLYAFVRRRGYPVSEAEDLTQEFFQRLLEKDYLQAADQEKGRFRTFLLVAIKRFLANEWHRANAQKRGGGYRIVSIDAVDAEERYLHEPVDHLTPDALYERRWALLILERALAAVRRDMDQVGKVALFEALKDALTGGSSGQSYAEIGEAFGLTEGAVKATVHRLRGRFRRHLRDVIAETLHGEDGVEDEIHHLFSVFSGQGRP